MTKPLRDLLPAGSARNKIEYLADQMEMTVEALYQEMAGLKGAKNLLANPRFNEFSYVESESGTLPSRNICMIAGQAPDLSRTIGNGRGSMLVVNHWAVEVPSTVAPSRIFSIGLPEYFIGDYDKESAGVRYYASDFTLYQVLNVPTNGVKHNRLKGRFAIAGDVGTKVTVGIAEVGFPDAQVRKNYWSSQSEQTYTFDQNVPVTEPITLETGEFKARRWGQSATGTVALYIKIEGGLSGYIQNAALWHCDVDGDSPTRFVEHHQPDSYGMFQDFVSLSSAKTERNDATRSVKYGFDWYLPYYFNPQKHIILNCRSYTSAVVTDIKPDSVTVQFSQADYDTLLTSFSLGFNFWLQYSTMPVGIGFY
ncbi:hypothetical protein [Photobacterium sp. TY1-4]|uniref:hypothetical protein n=1 Tax=Photobacterium sp. TY1-4 TaxID=2899122 RepID=UPI0021C10A34|nr:hypothetical protein [Photobacterium sp. TY1-4]UXI02746.1 hypothetical protein NH461_08300 [Photobacterium sp. TY1-4]